MSAECAQLALANAMSASQHVVSPNNCRVFVCFFFSPSDVVFIVLHMFSVFFGPVHCYIGARLEEAPNKQRSTAKGLCQAVWGM